MQFFKCTIEVNGNSNVIPMSKRLILLSVSQLSVMIFLPFQNPEMGSLLFYIAKLFATQFIGGVKELVVPLWLSGDI